MMIDENLILECQEKVFSGIEISPNDAESLLSVSELMLPTLATAANEITRKFNGIKVDVEQLNNIKKNGCSEDCSFCSQSAFYDTQIERYQLPLVEQIIEQAQKAYDDGAQSYCLVAAWREPSPSDFVSGVFMCVCVCCVCVYMLCVLGAVCVWCVCVVCVCGVCVCML